MQCTEGCGSLDEEELIDRSHLLAAVDRGMLLRKACKNMGGFAVGLVLACLGGVNHRCTCTGLTRHTHNFNTDCCKKGLR